MNNFLYFSYYWGKWDNSNIEECKPEPLENEMNQNRFNNCQEAFDNQDAPFDEGLQTQEEIDNEADQEFKYNKLLNDTAAGDNTAEGYDAFCDMVAETARGECNEAGDLLFKMIVKAADYNGSEAEVPDFVRLVRMAFEWKSKQ